MCYLKQKRTLLSRKKNFLKPLTFCWKLYLKSNFFLNQLLWVFIQMRLKITQTTAIVKYCYTCNSFVGNLFQIIFFFESIIMGFYLNKVKNRNHMWLQGSILPLILLVKIVFKLQLFSNQLLWVFINTSKI